MRETSEHRGVMYSIPHNDDGVWHYRIHPKRERRTTERGQPQSAPAEGFPTREAAIASAKRAIDAWLARVPMPTESSSTG